MEEHEWHEGGAKKAYIHGCSDGGGECVSVSIAGGIGDDGRHIDELLLSGVAIASSFTNVTGFSLLAIYLSICVHSLLYIPYNIFFFHIYLVYNKLFFFFILGFSFNFFSYSRIYVLFPREKKKYRNPFPLSN